MLDSDEAFRPHGTQASEGQKPSSDAPQTAGKAPATATGVCPAADWPSWLRLRS